MKKIYQVVPVTGVLIGAVEWPIDVAKSLAVKTTIYAGLPPYHITTPPTGAPGECRWNGSKWEAIPKAKAPVVRTMTVEKVTKNPNQIIKSEKQVKEDAPTGGKKNKK